MAKKTKCERVRYVLGLTQAEMAAKLGVNQATISKWEAGAKPSGPALKLIEGIYAELSNV